MPVKFYLESRPNKANEHTIRVSICVKSVKYISTIGYSVDAAKWQDEEHSSALLSPTEYRHRS